jgi:hypothetical protein
VNPPVPAEAQEERRTHGGNGGREHGGGVRHAPLPEKTDDTEVGLLPRHDRLQVSERPPTAARTRTTVPPLQRDVLLPVQARPKLLVQCSYVRRQGNMAWRCLFTLTIFRALSLTSAGSAGNGNSPTVFAGPFTGLPSRRR